MQVLQRGWNKNLLDIFNNVDKELIISSPYISHIGAQFLLDNVPIKFKEFGVLKFITDLSAKNIYQGSTNPKSFKILFSSINAMQIFHLPRLHAKVYISDEEKAIITSGNLTAGGIYNNFEYGVFIDDIEYVSTIKNDLLSYGNLGANISSNKIDTYSHIADEIIKFYREREKSTKKEIESNFKKAVLKANDELVKAKLREGALHNVFEKTILYLLNKNGHLPTKVIHNLVEEIHPDLCNNEIDRVINGVHFGKKWKHAVRTAQQNLKKKGFIELTNGSWNLIK